MADILKLGPQTLHASSALTGNEDVTIYRGQNMMLRGEPGSFYFECFSGILNLNERVPSLLATGTVSFVAGSKEIEGTGTLFKDELHIGQHIYAGEDVLVVEEIISDTLFLCDRPPYGNSFDVLAYKLPILFEIANQRGVLSWGNALKFDLGNIVCVGEGQLRLNGEILPGQSLVADRRVKIAIFNPETDTYSVERFGFTTTPSSDDVAITVVTGGKKNMTAGNYSFRWAWANKETAYGFSNPSDVIKIDGSGNSLAITATNQRFKLDFTEALSNKPSNADSIIIYRSFFATGSRSNLVSYAEGSWYVAKTVQISELLSGDVVYIDVLDAELGTEVTFDNDPPPDAEWVTALAGDLVLLSCYGDKTVANPNGTSPGPMVVPQRRGNRDAFPTNTSTPLSPPDTIIGFAASVGRVFLMTRVGLPFATSTGQADFPITTRPFWQTGFKGPFGLAFVNDTLYAFTSKGITRSIATGDEGSEQFAFAQAVEDITRTWYAGHVHVVPDPANELVLFIYSASHRNEEGYWVSTVLPFSLRHGAFTPKIIIQKPGRDMVVCGAAKINGQMQFLAGGRGTPEAIGSGSGSEEPPVGSSMEGSGSDELWAPLEGAILTCGFECGLIQSDAHVAQEVLGTTEIVDTVSRSGRFSLRTEGSNRMIFPSLDYQILLVGRIYVRFGTLPLGSPYVIYSGLTQVDVIGVAYHQPTQTLRTKSANTDFSANGHPVVLDQWYRIDFRIHRHEATVRATITTDGDESDFTVLDELTHWPWPGTWSAETPGSNFLFRMGCLGGAVGDANVVYYDDVCLSTAEADYPIAQGYVHAFVPTADGNHNVTTQLFEVAPYTLDVGVPLLDGATTAHTYIDKRPMNVGNAGAVFTDQIAAKHPAVSTDYLEFIIGPAPDTPTPTQPPRIVGTIVGMHETTTGSGQFFDTRVAIKDNNTLAYIWEENDIGNPVVETQALFIPSPPTLPGQPWNLDGGDGDFNNLRARFYLHASPVVGTRAFLDGIVVEAEFAGEEPA